MANNIYTLGATNEAAAKSASRFIRDGVRNGGYSGLVDDTTYTHTNPSYTSASSDNYPPVALVTGSLSSISQASLVDIVTGEPIQNIVTLIPVLSLNPVEVSGRCLVFYGTTEFIASSGFAGGSQE